MIEVRSIKKSFGDQVLFEEVSFQIGSRERIGLTGRNGAGKSTLFRMISGDEEIDGGSIVIPKSYRIGQLRQHLIFNRETILDEVVASLPPESEGEVYLAEKLLSGLGFSEEDMYKPASDFSGGYQLRVELASVIVSDPDLLLLDEPTNYLDLLSIRWLAKFLCGWKGELVLITHDRTFMDSVVTHVMGIHRHKILKIKGNTESFYTHIAIEEEVYEKTRSNLEKRKSHLQSYIDRFGAKASKAAQAQGRVKLIEKMPVLEKLAALGTLSFLFNEVETATKIFAEVHDLEFAYPGMEKPLIHNLTFEVKKGDKIAVIGKNGRGKSTLLKLLTKELTPSKGKMRFSQNAHMGYFSQMHQDQIDLTATVFQSVKDANPALSDLEVRGICGSMLFTGLMADKTINLLSGGEKSRVRLARLIARASNLILLDEPTNHLDIETVEALIQAISAYEGGVIIVSHSEELLRRVANRILICTERGQEMHDCTYDQFLESFGFEEEGGVKKKGTKKEKTEKRLSFLQTLRPFKKEAETLEETIGKLEAQKDLLEKEIVALSSGGNGHKLTEVTKKHADLKTQIDGLYIKLEHALDEISKLESLEE